MEGSSPRTTDRGDKIYRARENLSANNEEKKNRRKNRNINQDMTILETIEQLINERKEQRKIPHCADILDVKRLANVSDSELNDEIERLKKEGKISIKIRPTINSFTIYLE